MIQQWGRKIFKTALEKAYSRAVFTVFGIAIKELRVSFTQFFTWRNPFSIVRTLKYSSLALLRLVFGRSVRLSYSFTAEDRLIESLLKPLITYNGFYVDVGCNDPRFISNSFLFYKRGWRGICIDANQELIKKHQRIRPKDKAVCALVSNKKENKNFVELTNNVLSSADEMYLKEMKLSGQNVVKEVTMTSRTLTEILDECNAPSVIDFLSVDIEEFDLLALQSLDFAKYQPRLIVTEAEDFDPSNPPLHPIYKLLTSKGYSFKGSLLTNLYFMKE